MEDYRADRTVLEQFLVDREIVAGVPDEIDGNGVVDSQQSVDPHNAIVPALTLSVTVEPELSVSPPSVNVPSTCTKHERAVELDRHGNRMRAVAGQGRERASNTSPTASLSS